MNRACFVAMLSLTVAATAQADSMRCGDQVIAEGDDKVRVLRYCGKPVLKERLQTKARLSAEAHGDQRRQRVHVERWVYDMPRGQLSRRLVFVDGAVAEIETGDRQ